MADFFKGKKTLITSGVAFVIAILTAIGAVDVETGLKVEALLVPLIFAFLRMGVEDNNPVKAE